MTVVLIIIGMKYRRETDEDCRLEVVELTYEYIAVSEAQIQMNRTCPVGIQVKLFNVRLHKGRRSRSRHLSSSLSEENAISEDRTKSEVTD